MRIAFFTYGEWAFGSIHRALCKELYKKGIYANLIEWNIQYSREEFNAFSKLYDYFVTVPGNPIVALNSYGITNDRIIAVAHGRYDVQGAVAHGNKVDEFHRWGGVSPDLQEYARGLGINREMGIALNGIHFDYFYSEPSTSLQSIGYGGAMEYKNHLDGNKDLKRGYLIKQISEAVDIPVKIVSKRSYLAMPEYYPNVDCVMVSSTEESCGLPLMEGAAAGRLPISTPVGVSRDFENAPGIVLPFPEEEYVSEAIEILDTLKGRPNIFKILCRDAQEFARYNYDWSVRIDDWVKLLV